MADVQIGYSEYGDLRGIMQTLAPTPGRQFIAWMNEVHKRKGWSTRTIMPNEGRRGADRCRLLWGQYVARGYAPPVVARPLTSNHYPGTAVDLGGPMASVLTSDDLAILHATCADYGFAPTGLGFSTPELWHFDYIGRPKWIAATKIKFVYPTPRQAQKASTKNMSQTDIDNAKAAKAIALDLATNDGKLIAEYKEQIDGVYRNRLGRPDGADIGGLQLYMTAMFLGNSVTWVDAKVKQSAEYKKRQAAAGANAQMK